MSQEQRLAIELNGAKERMRLAECWFYSAHKQFIQAENELLAAREAVCAIQACMQKMEDQGD